MITCRLDDGRGISFHGGGLGNQQLKAFSSPVDSSNELLMATAGYCVQHVDVEHVA